MMRRKEAYCRAMVVVQLATSSLNEVHLVCKSKSRVGAESAAANMSGAASQWRHWQCSCGSL